MTEKIIYKLSDDLLFRQCTYVDCTMKSTHWAEHMKNCAELFISNCLHEGDIHFHCSIHREIELSVFDKKGVRGMRMICAVCSLREDYLPPSKLQRLDENYISSFKQQARALLTSNVFKKAKLVRLDDYYTPELSEKLKTAENSKYWVSYDVKENKSGQPVFILYLGSKSDNSKCQFFIEPESKKLSHDHKDTDPLRILSRIEVQFKGGIITLKDSEALSSES